MRLKEQLKEIDHWPIMEEMLGFEVEPRKMYRSPVREGDRTPSFGLYRAGNGQAYWKDFAYEQGDVYRLAMLLYGCRFREAMMKVAQIAGIAPGRPGPKPLRKQDVSKLIERERAKCSFTSRRVMDSDALYWLRKYAITPDDLARFRIYLAESFSMQPAGRTEPVIFRHTEENPLYVMEIGNKGHLKMYRPLHRNKQYKYMGNTDANDVFGMHLMEQENKSPLVITAGQKDAVNASIYLGINTVAFNSESTIPSENILYGLFMSCSGNIYSLYDNDDTGRKYGAKLSAKYPIVQQIDLSEFSTSKDFSDLVDNRELDAIQAIRQIVHRKTEEPNVHRPQTIPQGH